MRRTNTFAVRPLSEQNERLLRALLDASASLWNALNYERRKQFFEGEFIWDTADYHARYVGLLGSATAKQVIRKNSEAWWSFFATCEAGETFHEYEVGGVAYGSLNALESALINC